MKTFIKKTLLYLLIIALIVITTNLIYINKENDDSDHTGKFANIPNKIKVCNIGSSHGMYGFDYSEYKDKEACFNFALPAQLFSYDYRILLNYSDNLEDDCVVLIPVSYFNFVGVQEEQEFDFLSKNKRYYKFLPAKHIKEYDLLTDVYIKYPIITKQFDLINVLLFGETKADESETNKVEIDRQKDAQEVYTRHLIDGKLDDDGNYIVRSEEIDSLKKIIELCLEKGWKPYLITTPYLREYTDLVYNNGDFLQIFENIISNVCNETGVEYYNYSRDNRFIDNYEMFGNCDHLNRQGALKFTNIVLNEIVR